MLIREVVWVMAGGSTDGSGLGSTTPAYSGGAGSTSTSTSSINDIINNLKNPCFYNIAQNLTTSNMKNAIADIINQFKISDQLNITFIEDSTISVPAKNVSGNTNDFTILINPSKFNSNASMEYKTITVLHEIIHAEIDLHSIGIQTNQQMDHLQILCGYIDKMSVAMTALFPNMTLNEAESLCFDGLNDLIVNNNNDPLWTDWSTIWNQALGHYGLNQDPSSLNNIGIAIQKYELGQQGSTPCN
ncbi:MAG: hypothetical protein KGL19_08055 [Bacteroidota bacterium]|nr:hypothetical protein [Bacteroidota bacterium]